MIENFYKNTIFSIKIEIIVKTLMFMLSGKQRLRPTLFATSLLATSLPDFAFRYLAT